MYVPRIYRNCLKCSQNPPPGPPKTGQVGAKIGSKPLKLVPRWPFCCHLGPSWARLCASWRQLCPKFSKKCHYSGRKFKKQSQEPLQTFIFFIFDPPGDDFHDFSCFVFLVFVSVFHLRFMLQAFLQTRFAHACWRFFRTRPDIKLCCAGRLAKRAQSGAARPSAASPCKMNLSNTKFLGWEFSPPLPSPGHASAAGRPRPL